MPYRPEGENDIFLDLYDRAGLVAVIERMGKGDHVLKGLFILQSGVYDKVYGLTERQEIEQFVEIYAPPQTASSIQEDPSVLAEAEVIFSGWGMAPPDRASESGKKNGG